MHTSLKKSNVLGLNLCLPDTELFLVGCFVFLSVFNTEKAMKLWLIYTRNEEQNNKPHLRTEFRSQ